MVVADTGCSTNEQLLHVVVEPPRVRTGKSLLIVAHMSERAKKCEVSRYEEVPILRSRMRRPNGLAFSCRERATQDVLKKGTISRAQRSAALPGWAGGLALLSFCCCAAFGRYQSAHLGGPS